MFFCLLEILTSVFACLCLSSGLVHFCPGGVGAEIGANFLYAYDSSDHGSVVCGCSTALCQFSFSNPVDVGCVHYEDAALLWAALLGFI